MVKYVLFYVAIVSMDLLFLMTKYAMTLEIFNLTLQACLIPALFVLFLAVLLETYELERASKKLGAPMFWLLMARYGFGWKNERTVYNDHFGADYVREKLRREAFSEMKKGEKSER
jgi:hypothetical protein